MRASSVVAAESPQAAVRRAREEPHDAPVARSEEQDVEPVLVWRAPAVLRAALGPGWKVARNAAQAPGQPPAEVPCASAVRPAVQARLGAVRNATAEPLALFWLRAAARAALIFAAVRRASPEARQAVVPAPEWAAGSNVHSQVVLDLAPPGARGLPER